MASTGGSKGGRRGEVQKKQKLVFMPASSNPLVDSKKPEVRMMVARYAMQNRPKNQLNTTSFPENAARVDASSSSSPSSSKPKSAPVPIPVNKTHAKPSSRTVCSVEYTNPLGVIVKGGKQYYALRTTDNGRRPKGNSRKTLDSNRTSAFQSSPVSSYSPQAMSWASFGSHSSDSVYGPAFDELDDLQVPVFTKQGHIALDLDFRNIDSSTMSYSNTDDEFDQQHLPLSVISGNINPFDCLPVPQNRYTSELLDLYLSGSYLSPAFTRGDREIISRVKAYRRSDWFPQALQSKVLMHALMSWIETTPGLPVKSKKPQYLYENVSEAYAEMRLCLDDERPELDDSVCMALLLLLLTAMRLGDIYAFREHAKALRVLLKFRAQAFRRHKTLRHQTEERWAGLTRKINGPPHPTRCNYCHDSSLRPDYRSPSPEEGGSPEPAGEDSTIPIQARGAGFYDLVNRGLLQPCMKHFVEEIMVLAELVEHTRHDQLSCSVASSHAWIDEQPFQRPAFDSACQYSARLCLYLSNWLALGHSCIIVRMMSGAVVQGLRHPSVDMEELLVACPLVLIWLSLVAGPFIQDDEPSSWIKSLLARARNSISHLSLDFNASIDVVGRLFVWINTMTPGAWRFWNETFWDPVIADATYICADEEIVIQEQS